MAYPHGLSVWLYNMEHSTLDWMLLGDVGGAGLRPQRVGGSGPRRHHPPGSPKAATSAHVSPVTSSDSVAFETPFMSVVLIYNKENQ